MIHTDNIPEEELIHIANNSIFKYQLGFGTIKNRDMTIENVINSNFSEDLQLLDNGTLIICQNKFGGQALISEFTCGFYFCLQMEKQLVDLKFGKRITRL